ncbi:hypothetical protein DSUL_40073 [Desulfovibrionales bacterium]
MFILIFGAPAFQGGGAPLIGRAGLLAENYTLAWLIVGAPRHNSRRLRK